MGMFSGILLCTDFDGTLAYKQTVCQRNVDAIKYFQEQGGLFTIITGRTQSFFKEHTEIIRPNTYLGCVNGSLIYDITADKIICESFVTGDILTPSLKIKQSVKNLSDVMVFRPDGIVTVSIESPSATQELTAAMAAPVYKVIFHAHSQYPFTEENCRTVSELLGEKFEAMRSWNCGIEVQNRGYNKGRAARRIAELVGAKLVVCVGDYENDISMIKQADIGYAVGNALDSVKAAADRITVSAEEGAIAAIIEDLEGDL